MPQADVLTVSIEMATECYRYKPDADDHMQDTISNVRNLAEGFAAMNRILIY